jgi:hypothetical protein
MGKNERKQERMKEETNHVETILVFLWAWSARTGDRSRLPPLCFELCADLGDEPEGAFAWCDLPAADDFVGAVCAEFCCDCLMTRAGLGLVFFGFLGLGG